MNELAPDELARATRALKVLSAGNRTLVRATAEQKLLRDMCRVIVETGGYRLACVAYAKQDEQKTIRWMVCEGIDKSFLDAIPYTWADTEFGQTASGQAIRSGQPVVGRHLTDPDYRSPAYDVLRAEAARHHYSAITAIPLRIDGEVIGALIMAAAEPDAFDQREVELVSELADDLAYGIGNLRVQARHREAQATIARLAYYDPLTGLPNRTLLRERLDEAIKLARQQHQPLGLLHLEVGRFQEINKVLGYRAGDELMRELAQRLARTVQENETLARVGDAQFALLLPKAGADQAIRMAQQLSSILRGLIEMSGLMVDASVAIGIALFPGHAKDADSLMRRADAAAHQARPGRGGCAMYTGGQEEKNTRRLALMGDLRHAIEQNELRLYCQPKVNIASGHVCGAEALVRWPHPAHGMIATSEFIGLAEQAGLITPLTDWVLESAFSQSYAWREAGLERPLAVNLSAHDLYDPRLVDRIRGMFSTWGTPPELLQFELTESAFMEDPASALETLADLKHCGTKLYIDDFGTGYSSLGYLQKLPVDSVKIDQSFVAPMVEHGESAAIVRSTIQLGHNLDLEIVAEGVESQAVWDRLMTLGCDVAQGYHVSTPMPADQFIAWEAEWSRRPGHV